MIQENHSNNKRHFPFIIDRNIECTFLRFTVLSYAFAHIGPAYSKIIFTSFPIRNRDGILILNIILTKNELPLLTSLPETSGVRQENNAANKPHCFPAINKKEPICRFSFIIGNNGLIVRMVSPKESFMSPCSFAAIMAANSYLTPINFLWQAKPMNSIVHYVPKKESQHGTLRNTCCQNVLFQIVSHLVPENSLQEGTFGSALRRTY